MRFAEDNDFNAINFGNSAFNFKTSQDDGFKFYTDTTVDTATPEFAINEDGHATFRNNTDAATAFQIQNSSGTSLLTVDTGNDRVQVSGEATVLNGPTQERTTTLRSDETNDRFQISSHVIGNATPGDKNGDTDSGNNDMMTASRYNSGTGGTINALYFFAPTVDPDSGQNKIKVAVYSNTSCGGGNPDCPGSKLANSDLSNGAGTVLTAGAWTRVPLTSTLTLAPNTKYWLAFNVNGNDTTYTGLHSGTESSYTAGGGTNFDTVGAPSTWTENNADDWSYAIYAPYTTVDDLSYSKPTFMLSDGGQSTFRTNSDGVHGFSIQNASGGYAMDVDTSLLHTTIGNNTQAVSDATLLVDGQIGDVPLRVRRNDDDANSIALDGTETLFDLRSDYSSEDTTQLQVKTNGNLLFGNTSDKTISVAAAASGNNGRALWIKAGDGTGTNKTGGDLILQGGNKTGSASPGAVIVRPQSSTDHVFEVQDSAGGNFFVIDTANDTAKIEYDDGGNDIVSRLFATNSSQATADARFEIKTG